MTATTKAKFEVSPKEQSQDRQLRLEEELAE
jgi:hypothetical protein